MVVTPAMCEHQVGGSSVAASENASRGGGRMLSSAWRPSRDANSAVTAKSGAPAVPPRLMDGPDSAHSQMQGNHRLPRSRSPVASLAQGQLTASLTDSLTGLRRVQGRHMTQMHRASSRASPATSFSWRCLSKLAPPMGFLLRGPCMPRLCARRQARSARSGWLGSRAASAI